MPIRVLIADDDPAMCELLRAIVQSSGMSAVAVTESHAAQARLLQEKFDVVFLDLHMPSPDGMELLKQMRTTGLNRKTPAVMITGDEDPAVLKCAFEAGAGFFLFKPVNRGRILRVLRASYALVQREKRRFQRVTVSCPVTIEANHRKLDGVTLDLSLNGLLAKTSGVFPTGARAEITLKLGAAEPPVVAKGTVVRHVGPDCMGIQFENRGSSDTARLQEFLLPRILAQMGKEEEPPAR